MNVWYETGENDWASNLSKRVFFYQGRLYISVEHAYQCLKSGEFDVLTYIRDWKAGAKFRGRKPANEEINRELMKDIMLASFEQNVELAKQLIATGSLEITHRQACPYWKVEFPKILDEIRKHLQENFAKTGEVRAVQRKLSKANKLL